MRLKIASKEVRKSQAIARADRVAKKAGRNVTVFYNREWDVFNMYWSDKVTPEIIAYNNEDKIHET